VEKIRWLTRRRASGKRAPTRRTRRSTGGGSPIWSRSAGRWTARGGAARPERKVLYQFSARGHDVAQVMLGSRSPTRTTAPCGYYRSRRCCSLWAWISPTRSAPAWAAPAAIPTGAISAWCSTIPTRTPARRCRCAAESAPSIRRPRAGRRRSAITRGARRLRL
jgi:hypothetical protein